MKTKKLGNIRLGFLCGVIIVGLIITGCGSRRSDSPPDSALQVIYLKNKTAFDQLQKMIFEDSQRGILKGQLDYKRLTDARRKQYETLLSQIGGGIQVVIDDQLGVVRFIFSSGEDVPIPTSPVWLKGIEHIPIDVVNQNTAGEYVTNLDSASSFPAGVYLRQIDPEWFLVYQRTE